MTLISFSFFLSCQALTPCDQDELIQINGPLFILYILSRFLCGEDSLQQLAWLLLLPEAVHLEAPSPALRKITANELRLVRDTNR